MFFIVRIEIGVENICIYFYQTIIHSLLVICNYNMIQFLRKRSSRSKVSKKKITGDESSDSLALLISKREWQSVSKRLLTSPEECSSENTAYIDSHGETLLHVACKHHPTYAIFEMLLAAFRDSVTTSNHFGQFPLHMASRHGLHPVLLVMLIQKATSILKKRDSDGRTPLHLACAFYSRNFMNIEDLSAMRPSTAATHAIKVLVRSDSSVVNAEDFKGCTGLEYAITCNSDMDTVRYLQKYCLRDWRGLHKKTKATKQRFSLTSLSRITTFIAIESKDTHDTIRYDESISTSTLFSNTTSSNQENPSSVIKQSQYHRKELDEAIPAYDKEDTVLSSLDIQV